MTTPPRLSDERLRVIRERVNGRGYLFASDASELLAELERRDALLQSLPRFDRDRDGWLYDACDGELMRAGDVFDAFLAGSRADTEE